MLSPEDEQIWSGWRQDLQNLAYWRCQCAHATADIFNITEIEVKKYDPKHAGVQSVRFHKTLRDIIQHRDAGQPSIKQPLCYLIEIAWVVVYCHNTGMWKKINEAIFDDACIHQRTLLNLMITAAPSIFVSI